MKLKAVLETLDGVDEAVKPFYTEKDGKFYLTVEDIDDHPEVKGLKTSLAKVRDEKKSVETKNSELTDKFGSLPDDFTVEEYHRLKDSGNGNIDQKLENQKARLEADFKRKEDKLIQERDMFKARAEKQHIDNAINTALAEANITTPAMIKAVRAMFQPQTKLDYEGDEAIVTIDNLPLVDKIKAWAGTDEGKYFVTAPANGGGGGGNSQPGTSGNTKDNPWSKEGFNLTKQVEILKSDPTKAAQLKAAAGIK